MRELIYEYCVDAIKYFRDKHLPVENTEDNEVRKEIDHVILTISNSYVLVEWPECQLYMEEDWFRKEAILHTAFDDQTYLDSVYFIPLKRLVK